MKVRYENNWVPPRVERITYNNTWVVPKARWIRIAGVWRQMVPANAVIMYMTTPPSNTFICNGSNRTPNLLNYYPYHKTDSSILSVGGDSLTHSGANHGASTAVNTSSRSGVQASSAIGFTNSANGGNHSHTHSIASHTHSTATITPNIPHVNLIPTIGGEKIYTNAVIPTSATISHASMTSLMADANFLNMYLRFASTHSSVTTAFTHGHAPHNMDTPSYTFSTSDKQPNSGSWAYTHYHSAAHAMPNSTIEGPVSKGVFAYKVTSDIYFDQLPSGSYCFFTTRDMPKGFTEIATAQYIRFKGNVSKTESNSHSHSGTCTTGSSVSTNNHAGTTGSHNEYILPSHTHTWTDTHATLVSNMPPYVVLSLGVKS